MGNIAAILSFFIPGLGQLYNREVKKGFLFNIAIITSIVLALNSTSFLFQLRILRAITLLIYFLILASIIWWWSVFDAVFNDREIQETGKIDTHLEFDGFDGFLDLGYRFPKLTYGIDLISRLFELLIVSYIVVILMISKKGSVEQFAYDIGVHHGIILLLLTMFVFFKLISFPIKMVNADWDKFEALSDRKITNFMTIRKMLDTWTFIPLLFFLGFVITSTAINLPSIIFSGSDPVVMVHIRNMTALASSTVLLIFVLFPVYFLKLLVIIAAKINADYSIKRNLRQIWLDMVFGITRLYGLWWISYNFVLQLDVGAKASVSNILGGVSYTFLALLFYLFAMILLIVVEITLKKPILLD